MSDVFKSGNTRVTIDGVQAFKLKIADMPERLQKTTIRQLLRESMMVVREDARAKVPTLKTAVTDKAGNPRRLPGTVRRALSVRTSKIDEKAGNVGVFVNVKPLKGAVYKGRGASRVLVRKSQRSASNPRDPFYWRWLEFGTKARKLASGKNVGAVRPYQFLQSAAGKLSEALDRFTKGMQTWAAKAQKTGNLE